MRSAATRAALSVFAVLGCALTFLLQPALLTPGGDLQAEADDSDIAVYNYDSLAASTTASANAQSGALRAYDAAAQLSRSSTAAPASAVAAKVRRRAAQAGRTPTRRRARRNRSSAYELPGHRSRSVARLQADRSDTPRRACLHGREALHRAGHDLPRRRNVEDGEVARRPRRAHDSDGHL